VDLMRVGAEQISPELSLYLRRLARRSPQMRTVLECCPSLSGTPISPVELVGQLVNAGFSVQRINADSGECSPVGSEDLASVFSTTLMVQGEA
jgi:hypothetical protein